MTEIYHVPHPGSRLDAIAIAAAHEEPDIHAPEEPESSPVVVSTRTEMPEECIPRTMVLGSANPFMAILPRDMRRRRAVIITGTQPAVLCETRELAQQVVTAIQNGGAAATLGIGGYIPASTVVTLESRDWMYAAVGGTATTITTPVTVIVERYAQDV